MQNFDGNFEQLAATMQASWIENREQPLLYSAEFLRSAFEQPGSSFELAPALYEGGELIAFGAAFPRRVRYAGREFRLALDSFITVAKEHKGKGLGGKIWAEIAARCKQQGLDGLITFCVEGDRMNEILPRYSEQYGFNTQRVYSVQYLARPLPQRAVSKKQTADPSILWQCAAASAEGVVFSRVLAPHESNWQCQQRWGAFGATVEENGKRGIITAYAIPTGGAERAMCGIIEDVFWHKLDAAGRAHLLDALMNAAAAEQVELLLCPVLGYADLEPLRQAGFRRTKRMLQMYLTSFQEELPLEALPSAYIDVF